MNHDSKLSHNHTGGTRMSYEAAKCPSCGFSFQVDPNANFTVCPSCGINIEPKNAIIKGGESRESHDLRNVWKQQYR
jgi:predicted Zn-ribbon and HTH transcriptional regulator